MRPPPISMTTVPHMPILLVAYYRNNCVGRIRTGEILAFPVSSRGCSCRSFAFLAGRVASPPSRIHTSVPANQRVQPITRKHNSRHLYYRGDVIPFIFLGDTSFTRTAPHQGHVLPSCSLRPPVLCLMNGRRTAPPFRLLNSVPRGSAVVPSHAAEHPEAEQLSLRGAGAPRLGRRPVGHDQGARQRVAANGDRSSNAAFVPFPPAGGRETLMRGVGAQMSVWSESKGKLFSESNATNITYGSCIMASG